MSQFLRPRRVLLWSLLALLLLSTVACSRSTNQAPQFQPEIARSPQPMSTRDWAKRPLPPKPTSGVYNPFVLDLRQMDLRDKDLSDYGNTLADMADFDTATKWPKSLPKGFDPARFLSLGKDPGLGVRKLHKQGITGKGISVAFIDQTLMVEHQEYKDRIRRYKEIGRVDDTSSMHGPAVASLLAGKEIGVAPDAIVTYYAAQFSAPGSTQAAPKRTFIYLAQAINEILDKNATLPEADKIRVIGASIGWGPQEDGYADIERAVARAKQEGVFVISTSLEQGYGFKFHGLGRDPLADPNDPNSYRRGSWWKSTSDGAGRLLIPMDSRTIAGLASKEEYAFSRQGGWSWCVPYIEGLYAMALQVKPNVTPDEFWTAAMETATSVTVKDDDQSYTLEHIVNPQALIKRLQRK